MARNAKTLSPSHVKQCILAESKFDFLRDLVKNIPDVSAAEEKEMMSAESSPNSSRFTEMTVPPRRIAREDSNSSSSSDVKIVVPLQPPRDPIKRALSTEVELPLKLARTETVTSTSLDTAIDLSKKATEEKPVITANFYQETLLTDEVQHRSVIKINPTYASPQPSTSYTPEPLKIEMVPKQVIIEKPVVAPRTPVTPITPILNIDFTKNLANPEIKLLDTAINVSVPKKENSLRQIHRQNSKTSRQEVKKIEIKPVLAHPVDIDSLNSGNLQIDEDYDT
ncbi:hypothetical protein PYW08_010437 [Mythimna loreyi]|uniref:Uncharacterized protein n=1 Tax=Mythimna loreyi TaxID=667449 RepID=A0ACC2Q6E5_9NEOP|nr:hypothetical protein PYW08_010437 [Mythimna loreyi]